LLIFGSEVKPSLSSAKRSSTNSQSFDADWLLHKSGEEKADVQQNKEDVSIPASESAETSLPVTHHTLSPSPLDVDESILEPLDVSQDYQRVLGRMNGILFNILILNFYML